MNQWQFYVAGRHLIDAQAGSRMALATLTRVCGLPVSYEDLGGAIEAAAGKSLSNYKVTPPLSPE